MAGKGRAVILHHRFIAGVAAIFNAVVNGGDLDRLAVRALKLVIQQTYRFLLDVQKVENVRAVGRYLHIYQLKMNKPFALVARQF